jgi:hypothetical protein
MKQAPIGFLLRERERERERERQFHGVNVGGFLFVIEKIYRYLEREKCGEKQAIR